MIVPIIHLEKKHRLNVGTDALVCPSSGCFLVNKLGCEGGQTRASVPTLSCHIVQLVLRLSKKYDVISIRLSYYFD
ncbi:hypothetical protein HMPREF0973_01306 [Prevotella veroralis F0319]|uniref:Uncharacterized protein n=1 Tax=Prevotella veroralis F0319 TaxID=649761 RepID=C9MNW7_9BACT|nr:hypothetical protein HMPREF0973_01306 [Prevotella veroralis F0319]